jgi:hypothetical protein
MSLLIIRDRNHLQDRYFKIKGPLLESIPDLLGNEDIIGLLIPYIHNSSNSDLRPYYIEGNRTSVFKFKNSLDQPEFYKRIVQEFGTFLEANCTTVDIKKIQIVN